MPDAALRPLIWLMICFVSAAAGLPARAAPPAEPPLRAAGLAANERTRVLVLASPHLAQQLDARADLESLDAVVERLAKFAPAIVAVERLPADEIDARLRRNGPDDPVLQTFATVALELAPAAQRGAGLEFVPAAAELERLLARIGPKRAGDVSEPDRMQAALLSAATYDPVSAALNWAQLPKLARKSKPGVPRELVDGLNRLLDARGEDVRLGVAVAQRLGHARVWPIDDQSDAAFQLQAGAALMREMQSTGELRKLQDAALIRELPKRIDEALKRKDLLGLYRWMNAPDYARTDLDAQWQLFFRTKLRSGLDRQRVALWEARNLAMAAHIRRAAATAPGRPVLVVIGASHKPFLEAYLRQMMDVDVVPGADVLGR